MKKAMVTIGLVCICILFYPACVPAQNTRGITGKPDTSYTTYSAYISSRKTVPDIKIAEETHPKNSIEQKSITYCTIGKRKLLLDVFYSVKKSKVKRIAIVFLHGGGWRSGNRSQHYPLAQRLAALGYVCITPEYRLSTEALYPAAVYDGKAALRWIHSSAKNYQIDTTKIVIAGFSAGGELAAFLGNTMGISLYEGATCNTAFSSNVQAIIDLDGTLSFVHPESGEGDDSKRPSAATYWFGYSKKEAPELWEQASPLKHVGKQTPPTLFINSSVDRMHAGRTDYINALTHFGIYTSVKSFGGAPHSFPLFHPWFEPTLQYIDEFLKKVFPSHK